MTNFDFRAIADAVNRDREESHNLRVFCAKALRVGMAAKLDRILEVALGESSSAAKDGKYDLFFTIEDNKHKDFEQATEFELQVLAERFFEEKKIQGISLAELRIIKEVDSDFEGDAHDEDFHYRGWELRFKW